MKRKLIVRIVDLQGDAYQIGVLQGKEVLASPLRDQQDFLHYMAREANAKESKAELQRLAPAYLRELEGMAEGLGMDVDTSIRLYSGYDIAFPEMGCTVLAQGNLYVRNYDFSPELYDARLVFMKPEKGFASVGFSQQITGRLDGMNEKGLVVGLHFVNSGYRGKGFIATTIVRMLLERCATIGEALELIQRIPHGYCYNYSMLDSSGQAIIVEAAPERQVIRSASRLACTNHFESQELQGMNRGTASGSQQRKQFVEELQNHNMTPISAYKQFNDRTSPLFFEDYQGYFGTLHTVVYSPKDLTVLLGVGADCQPSLFSLNDYLAGKQPLPELICGSIYV